MVRRNELACRDEWSRSLWQPVSATDPTGGDAFHRPPPSGPLPPTNPESLRSVLNQDLSLTASSAGEDVLLSEARIVSDTHESWGPPERPFPIGNFDPRTAIFRARETFRDRARAKAVADRQFDVAEAASDDRVSAGSVGSEPEEANAGQGAAEAAMDQTHAARIEDHLPTAAQEPHVGNPVAAELPGVDVETSVSERCPEPGLLENRSRAWAIAPSSDDIERQEIPPRPRAEQPALPAAAEQPTSDGNVAARRLDDGEGDRLPDWYRIDLPRVCRACRDYRPSADGQRGWCANAWAFTHSRLVHEDDLTPCQSTIGDWWVPVDDVWLVAADVSSHGRATPLLDRLTGKPDPQRRRS